MFEDNSTYSEHDDEQESKDINYCKTCLCEVLSEIVEREKENEEYNITCDLKRSKQPVCSDIIPFIIQTPYGHPFFTWGRIGTKQCFATVFFRVVKVDCKNNCAVLQLLKPNKSIIDEDTDCVENSSICEVDFVTQTKECVVVDLKCYSSVKFISPSFIKKYK
ncbi:CotY/CotZ family spore coat protein [Virgibacillus halodenitrificans]|uniref:CotY/CotZ family spore coat protein n=1 Tax=Virgibacillus halodenitrificans TaxID=1482 RepID=UPI000761D0C0